MAVEQRAGLSKKREKIFAHAIVGRFCETPFELASDTDALQTSGFIVDLAGRIGSDFAGQSVAVSHGDDFDFDVGSLR